MQQYVYRMKFRNVCKVKKQLVEPGLVCSRTLSTLLSMNEESVLKPIINILQVLNSGPTCQAILLQAVEK